MKKKPVDITGMFDDIVPPKYKNSKEFLEVIDIRNLLEWLRIVSNNVCNDLNLTYIVGLNYPNTEVELKQLDNEQMSNLKNEIGEVLLKKILNKYEEELKVSEKVITLYE